MTSGVFLVIIAVGLAGLKYYNGLDSLSRFNNHKFPVI